MIKVRNTNTAMYPVYDYIYVNGVEEQSRNGTVLTVLHPVTIGYSHPQECVNFCPVRDANPYFHFMEMLWFLEGIGDTKLISYYLPNMVDYSDDGDKFNAHYGYNIRTRWFDQLDNVVRILKTDPYTRRAVLQIWNPYDLINTKSKDLACNLTLVFRMQQGRRINDVKPRLDMTVYNRSNDAIWGGVSGANITNLFAFQMYVTLALDVEFGTQYVVSNNLHIYKDNPKAEGLIEKYAMANPMSVDDIERYDPYTRGEVKPYWKVNDVVRLTIEVRQFLNRLRNNKFIPLYSHWYSEPLIQSVAVPLARSFWYHKNKDRKNAMLSAHNILAEDWRKACVEWLGRRK